MATAFFVSTPNLSRANKMTLPGEKLIIRIWESVADKGIGSIFRPAQIRREGLANIEVRRAEQLALAQMEREIQEIRNGTRELSDFSLKLPFADERRVKSNLRVEPVINTATLIEKVSLQGMADSLQKEVNITKALIYAEESVMQDDAEPSDEKVEDDWIYRWKDCASQISSDDMQRLWGRLLAGEVKQPGAYSLRCLEFVRNLSQREAKLIERVLRLDLDGAIWSGFEVEDGALRYAEYLELESLGILTGVTGNISNNITTHEPGVKWIRFLRSHKKGLLITHSDLNATLKIKGYAVSALGLQMKSLAELECDEKYLRKLGEFVKEQGFSVEIVDYLLKDGYYMFGNAIEL
ncbi:hypothetical protein PspCFBP13508_17960 [Pseudomonas sp. CFBP13508]|nr:hypothetical protein PspCFBP13508_17960 [Pseudomonas sp. CFBP13508]